MASPQTKGLEISFDAGFVTDMLRILKPDAALILDSLEAVACADAYAVGQSRLQLRIGTHCWFNICISAAGGLFLAFVDDVTYLLKAAEQGDAGAARELLPLVYEALRQLAAQRLAQEKPGQTLEATALVHEAYLRLVNVEQAHQWNGRGHFFAAAAEAMRRILVENARRKNRLKHGGDRTQEELHSELVAASEPSDDLLALDEALRRLAVKEPQVAKLVQLRYFGGLTISDAAEILGIAPRTANAYWAYARSWLRAELRGDNS